MSQSLAHSQLLRVLHELSLQGREVPHWKFVATLSKCVNFANAIDLADTLADLPSLQVQSVPTEGALEQAKEAYLKARGQWLEALQESFIPNNHGALMRLPKPSDDEFNASAYQRFYALCQSEMEARTLKLTAIIRRLLAGCSSPLAQLAKLDSVLAELLAGYSRKALAAMSGLLAVRYQALVVDGQDPTQGLNDFLTEMQHLLVAEWELRLQPSLGLIEALTMTEELPHHD